MVSGSTNSNTVSDAYRDSIFISYDFIGNVEPEISVDLFGRTFSTPIFAGPIAGATQEFGGTVGYAKAVHEAGSLFLCHFHDREAWVQILQAGLPALRVIKPLEDMEQILEEIKFDTESGAFGYAMDISHGRNVYGEKDGPGANFEAKTKEDLIKLNGASPLPFILKDVQSVKDALIAKEIGIAGLLLSGHNNRFPCAVPPLYILPKIREAVGSEMKIFVDGGILTGYEAYKALALGADGVMCARHFMAAFQKEGQEGLTQKILEMTAQLKGAMAATNSADLKHISKKSIVIPNDFGCSHSN